MYGLDMIFSGFYRFSGQNRVKIPFPGPSEGTQDTHFRSWDNPHQARYVVVFSGGTTALKTKPRNWGEVIGPCP